MSTSCDLSKRGCNHGGSSPRATQYLCDRIAYNHVSCRSIRATKPRTGRSRAVLAASICFCLRVAQIDRSRQTPIQLVSPSSAYPGGGQVRCAVQIAKSRTPVVRLIPEIFPEPPDYRCRPSSVSILSRTTGSSAKEVSPLPRNHCRAQYAPHERIWCIRVAGPGPNVGPL